MPVSVFANRPRARLPHRDSDPRRRAAIGRQTVSVAAKISRERSFAPAHRSGGRGGCRGDGTKGARRWQLEWRQGQRATAAWARLRVVVDEVLAVELA